jgi:hypothetical protein
MEYLLIKLHELAFFLVVVDGLDDGDNGDGNQDGNTFHPLHLICGTWSEGLVKTEGKRDNGSNTQEYLA